MTTTAGRAAAALRDIADMVEATGVTSIEIKSLKVGENVSIVLRPINGRETPPVAMVEAIAQYIGGGLTAYREGDCWMVRTPHDSTGQLRCGAEVNVWAMTAERPTGTTSVKAGA